MRGEKNKTKRHPSSSSSHISSLFLCLHQHDSRSASQYHPNGRFPWLAPGLSSTREARDAKMQPKPTIFACFIDSAILYIILFVYFWPLWLGQRALVGTSFLRQFPCFPMYPNTPAVAANHVTRLWLQKAGGTIDSAQSGLCGQPLGARPTLVPVRLADFAWRPIPAGAFQSVCSAFLFRRTEERGKEQRETLLPAMTQRR